MKHISHPCKEDLSVSEEGSEEVKEGGKHSSFPSSSQICSNPLLVLLQDAFPKENSPFSIAVRGEGNQEDSEQRPGNDSTDRAKSYSA